MESVQKWFESGCGYQEGVVIYASLPSCSPILLKRLQGGQDAARLEKLKYELNKYYKPNFTAPAAVITAAPAAPPPAESKPLPKKYEPKLPTYFHELPAELRSVLFKANDTFKQRCLLKVALNELAPEMESEALAIQTEMFFLRKQNLMCWKKIDYWREHKALPPALVKNTKTYTPEKMGERKQLLHSSTSRLRRRLAENRTALALAITTKDISKLQRAIAKQEANLLQQENELFEITQLINAKPVNE